MSVSRRDFVRSAGLLLASGSLLRPGSSPGAWGATASLAGEDRNHMILITLRGGFDAVMSLNPQVPGRVADTIHCGYRADDRVKGAHRLFGPLIGGLERHDAELCLLHGVRSDTTNHPDGLKMLDQGSVRARPERFANRLGEHLPGGAPLAVLDLSSPDGSVVIEAERRPPWAAIRDAFRRDALESWEGDPAGARSVDDTLRSTAHVSRFLDETRGDAAALDTFFAGDLAEHLRLAFQAVRGNWARCVNIATRTNWFDSHSDNDRFQRQRQPSFFADLSALLRLLAAERVGAGRLLDRTTVAVFSEFGRFPRLNGEKGKDHWPENTWLLAGRGVRGGLTVGGTDRHGKGLPVDFRSGAVKEDGGKPLFIDNAFATLLRIAGGDPAAAGYGPEAVLDCVLA